MSGAELEGEVKVAFKDDSMVRRPARRVLRWKVGLVVERAVFRNSSDAVCRGDTMMTAELDIRTGYRCAQSLLSGGAGDDGGEKQTSSSMKGVGDRGSSSAGTYEDKRANVDSCICWKICL